MRIKAQALTQEKFEKYGTVISSAAMQPMAENNEITYWGKVSLLKMGDDVSTGIMLAHEREPIVLQMERHKKTAEILVSVEGDSIICFAAPSIHDHEIEDISAFIVKQGDAIAMHPGTWHWAAFPCQSSSSKFIVIFANDTEADDLETKDTSEAVFVDFDKK